MTEQFTTTDTPTRPAPQLSLLRLDLRFRLDEPAELPPFRGNLWRGVLGPALKRIDEGLLPGVDAGDIGIGSLYRTFFAPNMPHPYVVDAPGAPGFRRLEPGAEERIGLTLVGRAATATEAVLAAFDFAARAGIGRGLGADLERGRAHLSAATAVWRGAEADSIVFDEMGGYRPITARPPETPPCPAWLRVTLATPLRLVDDQDKLVGPDQFSAGALVKNLVGRVSMMCRYYGDAPLDADFRALKALRENLRAEEPDLDFADQKRWSGHQKNEIPIGGVVGSFAVDMRGREALFPYLWLGQWLHAGKGAVMGMGSIRLTAE